jgi:hypothetical protein
LFVDTPWHIPQPIRLAWDVHAPDEQILREVEHHARAQPGFRVKSEWMAERQGKLAEADARLEASLQAVG